MADRRPFHRPLHRARSATRAHVEAAQAELVADDLAVIVFASADGVAAPAHDQVYRGRQRHELGVAQDMEDRVADARRTRQVETAAVQYFIFGVDEVPEHREQHLARAANHLAVHERVGRCTFERQLESTIVLNEADVEIRIPFQQGA